MGYLELMSRVNGVLAEWASIDVMIIDSQYQYKIYIVLSIQHHLQIVESGTKYGK